MTDTILSEIRINYHILSDVQKTIADYVLGNPEKVILLSLADIAQACATSEATVLRFLRKLSLDSFQVFKVRIAQDITRAGGKTIYDEVKPGDSCSAVRSKVSASTIQAIGDLEASLDDADIAAARDALLSARRVHFMGVGASSFVAQDAYHKFARIGLDVDSITDSHMMGIVAANAHRDDCFFAVSHSGESLEVLSALSHAKERKSHILALTSYRDSSLAMIADNVLYSCTSETRYRSDAMASRIVQLVIIDILYVALVLAKGVDSVEALDRSRLAVAALKK